MKLRKGLIQLGILGLALVVGAAMPLVAQDTTVPKIVLVDGERVTTETAVGKQVRDRIQAAVADWESRITQSQGQLQAMLQNRQTQQLTLSSAALSQLDQELAAYAPLLPFACCKITARCFPKAGIQIS